MGRQRKKKRTRINIIILKDANLVHLNAAIITFVVLQSLSFTFYVVADSGKMLA